MTRRGCVVRPRLQSGARLMLGVCLLLGSSKLYGQREVIATASAATSQTPAAPTPSAPATPAAPPITIRPVSYVPEAPSQSPSSTPMLPPSALLSGLTNSLNATSPRAPVGGTSVPSAGSPSAPSRIASSGMAVPPAVVSIEVVEPGQLLLGRSFTHEIVVRNMGGRTIAELHIEEPLPVDVRVLKADPPALKRDTRLTWELRRLEPGGERRLTVELEPSHPGDLDLRPLVSFQTGNGLHTRVVRPPFSLEISADRVRVMRGEPIRFRIQLANHGDVPIRNVKIYDMLPPELHHPSGPKLGIERFGDLLPGESRTIDLETSAVASGAIRNEILAQADQGVEAKAGVDVVVSEPNLVLKIAGPTQTVTQRELDFQLEVANPSALTAKNVRLVQALPPSFEIVSSNGASLDNNQHALVWSLTDLGAGQRHRVTFRIKAGDGGDWPMTAAVFSQNFSEAVIKHTLHAEAAPSLKLEIHAREERLSVGADTIVFMHIFNKGDAPCAGVRLTVTLPDSVAPFKAEGPSSEQIEKQQVRFAPLAKLEAHGDVVYRLHIRGRRVGNGPIRVELMAEKQTAAEKEISIQVTAASASAAAAETSKSLRGETLR